jgi:hypothetical protein
VGFELRTSRFAVKLKSRLVEEEVVHSSFFPKLSLYVITLVVKYLVPPEKDRKTILKLSSNH